MRSQSKERRAKIVSAAKLVFLERGYDGASMSEISVRAGGSKQTLYNYFATKDELFVAVMMEKGAQRVDGLFCALKDSGDVRADLVAFGVAFLDFILAEEIMAFRRVIIAEGAKSKLGELFFEHGPKRSWQRLSAYFDAQIRKGAMRPSDPDRAAIHLQGLIEAGPFQRRLEGARGAVDESEVRETVEAAVDVFLSHYGAKAQPVG